MFYRMESFPDVASRVLQEFRTLLRHGMSLLGSTHLLQIITINMFTIHNSHIRGTAQLCCHQALTFNRTVSVKACCLWYSGGNGDARSSLHEQSTALGLSMFALLVQRCTELLKDTPSGEYTARATSSRVDVSQVKMSASIFSKCFRLMRFLKSIMVL